MFSPLADLPVGSADGEGSTGISADALVTFDFSSASAGVVLVAGQVAQDLTFFATSNAQGGSVEEADILGFGPVASGAIGEMLSLAATVSGASVAASGTLGFTVAGGAAVRITGRAPDVILTPWLITPGDGALVISTHPAVPVVPAWSVVIGSPGFSVLDYPNYLAGVSNVPFLGLSLQASVGNPAVATMSAPFAITAVSAGSVPAMAMSGVTLDLFGAASGKAITSGTTATLLDFPTTSTGRVGDIPVSGALSVEFSFEGSGALTAGNNAASSGGFDFYLVSAGGVAVLGSAAAFIDFMVAAEIRPLSQRRVSDAKYSGNGGRIITEAQANKLLGR